MKLYASPTSPFARKVRAVALEKRVKLAVEMLAPPYTAVASLNPLGKIPVLERDDGSVLFDSPVIVQYLDALPSPEPSLLGDGELRWSVELWQALGDGIMEATVLRMLETRREPAQQAAWMLERQESKIAGALDYAEARAGDGFLVGGRFTLADIALCAAVGYVDLRYPHPWRDARPRLAAYVERVGARACLAETRSD